MTKAVEAALRRHRALSLAALAALTLLAWIWLLTGAGMGMAPLFSLAPPTAPAAMADMPGMAGMSMADMPGMAMAPAPPAWWSPARFALTFSMWWIMMVAMMLPSAAPTMLLYATAARHGQRAAQPATGAFLAGYLGAWALFSLLATALQQLFERAALMAPMLMTSQSHRLSAAILVAAGLYQISPLKDACLSRCRNPAQFLSAHYRPGPVGALRMGVIHGSYCVGCCWLLMALLFVGGIMNLAWIALLTLAVAAEKLLPHGRIIAYALGVACLAAGAILLFR